MKKMLVVIALVFAASTAAAQNVQLGIRAGISSQDLDMGDAFNSDAKLGWHGAVVSRLRLFSIGEGLLGIGVFLQPEIVYSQNNYKLQPTGAPVIQIPATRASSPQTSKIRMKTVDIPLLVSVKVSIVRVQAGPVFNILNNYETIEGDIELTPLRPAVGYALGASVDIGALTIDGRYHGEFKKLESAYNEGSSVHDSIKGSLSSWSLGIGIMF